jgi:hypothetical protein
VVDRNVIISITGALYISHKVPWWTKMVVGNGRTFLFCHPTRQKHGTTELPLSLWI